VATNGDLELATHKTSDQVGCDTWWLHVVADELFTYLFADKTRGKAAPDAAGVLPGFTGVMVHDRLSMYFRYSKAQELHRTREELLVAC
jgi:hypothetical protein